ncbi:hypothetical protein CP8484711_1197A, partial [Chlamydia psittaci 84-8471/1]
MIRSVGLPVSPFNENVEALFLKGLGEEAPTYKE